MSQEWYVRRGNHEQGPFTPQELKQLADSEILSESEFVRTTMKPEWRRAGTVKGLFADTAQKQPASPPISPTRSDVPTFKVDESSKVTEPLVGKKKSGLEDLLSTANQAKGLAAAYAAKAQITRFSLPKAYRALGEEIFDKGSSTDNLNDIIQKITSIDQEIAQIAAQAEQRPRATEWKGKLKSGAAHVMDQGRVLKLKTRRGRLLQELGNMAFQVQGSQTGSQETVSSITKLMDKLTSLDEQVSRLSNGSEGPLWQRIPVALLLTVIVFPVGLLLVWLNPHLTRRQKGLCIATGLSLFLVAAFAFTRTQGNHLAASGAPLHPTSTVDRSIKPITNIEPEKHVDEQSGKQQQQSWLDSAPIDPQKYVDAQMKSVLDQIQKQQKDWAPDGPIMQRYRCKTCGGEGWYRYVDAQGRLVSNPCPTCRGSGNYLKEGKGY